MDDTNQPFDKAQDVPNPVNPQPPFGNAQGKPVVPPAPQSLGDVGPVEPIPPVPPESPSNGKPPFLPLVIFLASLLLLVGSVLLIKPKQQAQNTQAIQVTAPKPTVATDSAVPPALAAYVNKTLVKPFALTNPTDSSDYTMSEIKTMTYSFERNGVQLGLSSRAKESVPLDYRIAIRTQDKIASVSGANVSDIVRTVYTLPATDSAIQTKVFRAATTFKGASPIIELRWQNPDKTKEARYVTIVDTANQLGVIGSCLLYPGSDFYTAGSCVEDGL